MNGSVFAVTAAGEDTSMVLVASVHHAETLLRTLFWEDVSGQFVAFRDERLKSVKWHGRYLPNAEAVALLTGLADVRTAPGVA